MSDFAGGIEVFLPSKRRALQVRSQDDRTLLFVDDDGVHMPDDLTLDDAKYVIRLMAERFVEKTHA